MTNGNVDFMFVADNLVGLRGEYVAFVTCIAHVVYVEHFGLSLVHVSSPMAAPSADDRTLIQVTTITLSLTSYLSCFQLLSYHVGDAGPA